MSSTSASRSTSSKVARPSEDELAASASRASDFVRRGIPAAFGVLLAWLYVASAARGLWEDGYFVVRFAYNFWHHGTFAWNVSDGPVYGMTSQTLQLVGALLYAIAPHHLVLALKASLSLALLGSLLVIGRTGRRLTGSSDGLLPAFVCLSASLVLETTYTGLETAYALLAVAVAIHVILAFERGAVRAWMVVAAVLAVYFTRPDAVVIPFVLIAPAAWREPRKYAKVALGTGLGLGALLLSFYVYYGTAVPLPFYLKTHGYNEQSAYHVSLFAREKAKNVISFLYLSAPFLFMALHERRREAVSLVVAAIAFAAYHYAFTIETMGQSSRFYLPALAPLLVAAAISYPTFRARRRMFHALVFSVAYLALYAYLKGWDDRLKIDAMLGTQLHCAFLFAVPMMLLAPASVANDGALIAVVTFVCGALANPVDAWAFRDDEAILLAQIAPRRVFRGLAELRERIPVRALFHTDMGAPGVLFPEARVVDLDGLLNEDITLRHARFEDLCRADRPEAIFVPNHTYPELRDEVLKSECLRGYRAVDAREDSPLRVREDWVKAYVGEREP